jgi:hypothetical protein
MRVGRLVAFLLVLGVAVAIPGAALADSGTFSGSITATACGPKQPIQVAAGETTIDDVATTDVAANDITLELFDPAGSHVAHGDTLTSPEEIVYSQSSLQSGTWNTQVCPFQGGVLTDPAPYHGTWATSSGPPVGVPGSTKSGTSAAPSIGRTAGNLTFSPAIVVDPQRTEGEPLNFWDNKGNYWESGPWGTTTQNSFIHRSTDGGQEFHVDSPAGLRPDAPPGGGDTDIVVDDQGYDYFVDLEALVNLGTAVSNDNGNSWRKNPAAVENTAVDRQWYAVDNGRTASASDNTVFLAFHMSAVGTFIYSSPGSTGPADPVGGLVWQNSAANAPIPLASDATCAQPRFDPVKRNLYYACNEGDHVRMTIGHVDPGQRTGIFYQNVALPKSPGGGGPSHLFPAVAIDDAGNVYAAWIDGADSKVYYSYSINQGKTWSLPSKVNADPAVTNEFLWAQAGSKGALALAWYGTQANGQPDDFASWYDNPTGSTAAKWFGYVSVFSNANTTKPTAAQQRFTEHPMHYGQICNQGIGCTVSDGDRTMADFFGFSLDHADAIQIVFNDTTSQHHGAHLYAVRQLGPLTLHGKTLNRPTPANPMGDPVTDAQWPHYSPAGAGSNQPQMDLTKVALSQPSSGTLRVRMTLNSLGAHLPPPGKTTAVWLTRFQALSKGDFGEEAYAIFYVGAKSTAGGPILYFAGTGTCTDTTPQNCKVVNYPAEKLATGKVCAGTTIQVDVPFSAFGRPVNGNTLFSVTGLSFGQNADEDIYADVDASHTFDYVRGSNISSTGC